MSVVLIIFGVLLLLGMPVAFAIGIAGLVFFLRDPFLPLTMPVQLALSETQNFALLAIPMFVLAGNLMNETGVTDRLLAFASVITRHMQGGLAQVSVVLSTLMGGVSGSAIADASMESRILGPGMVKRGYSRGYGAAIHGASALITVAIPPSIGLVLYGSIGEVSIGRLFAGGIVPGLLITGVLMIGVAITARRRGYAAESDQRASWREVTSMAGRCVWALLFPVLLLVALRFGLLVPSEVGAVAAVYAVVIGWFVHRALTREGLARALRQSVRDVGMIMLLISMSALISYGIKWEMMPQRLAGFLVGLHDSPAVVVGVVLLFLLVLGTVVDSTVMILVLTSVLVPVMRDLGVDLVFFGVMMVLTCAFGLLTPPVGLAAYAVCSIMECSIGEYFREGWPFLLGLLLVLIILALFPGLVTFFPRLLFG
ncbi:MAG: TRAP transporter large permease subunit [Firmicutes bacterium]|nr:TRAP transporter large permease subunit [Bacillota bacterium]